MTDPNWYPDRFVDTIPVSYVEPWEGAAFETPAGGLLFGAIVLAAVAIVVGLLLAGWAR